LTYFTIYPTTDTMRCELQNKRVAVKRAEIFTENRDIFQNLTDS